MGNQMDYFNNEKIIAFTKDEPPMEPAYARLDTDSSGQPSIDTSTFLVFYEWDKTNKKWTKTKDSDPEPIQEQLPNGLFDGQIIEVEISDPR